jgi:HEAT repeat protein
MADEKSPTDTKNESAEQQAQNKSPDMPAVMPEESWTTERLIKTLQSDDNMIVRSNAVIILARREGQEAIEAMISALADGEQLVKSAAMVRLAEKGRPILDRVLEAMSDADHNVRAGAAWILGELKAPESVAALQKAVNDSSIVVRIQAKASLMSMGLHKPENKAQSEEKK